MASASGGVGATDEIPEVEMEVVEWPLEDPGLVGSKRVRGSPSAYGYYGFFGVTTAEKKPMLQPHNVVHMCSNGASKIDGQYLHGTHGLRAHPDSDALRYSCSTPAENLGSNTKICTLYAQGRCNKGKSCTFLHERGSLGSTKTDLLAPAGSGSHRGSGEGSQVQHQSNLKVPQLKDSEGSSKLELYRNLIHAYGEHHADKQNPPSPGVSQGMPGSTDDSLTKRPITITNELGQSPVVIEKNHKPFMGRHMGLATQTYLDGRSIFPRLDGTSFQYGMDKGNGLSDSHVSRTYLDVNTLNLDYQYRPFGLSISSGPLQFSKNLSAYGGITENIPNAHQNEHHSGHASYSSRSSIGFRNPGNATSEHSSDSPSFRGTSQLGIQSHHLFASGTEKVDYVDVDQGCGTSKPALLESSKPEPSVMPDVSLSPIKDELWVTSVPFVPSFSFPNATTPSDGLYDPFVDYAEPPKVGCANNLKSSNISCSISNQHTNQYVITDKLLNLNDKSTRNVSATGSKEHACLIASDRGRSSSLDDNKRVSACDRKKDAVSNNEKTRDFRYHLAEHIKELIKPIWKEGNLSKDAHKQVVKKSVEKVIDSIEPNQIPTTEELITKYITTCGSKIEKLVMAYVDRYRAASHPAF